MSTSRTDVPRALEDPVFRVFFGARTVAMMGSALSLVAFPVLVYQLTGSAGKTALMAVAESAPYLLIGLPAGALVDRWNRRRVMVVTGLVSSVLMVSIPVVDYVGLLGFGYLLGVGLGVATLWVFMDAASFGVVPQMVGRARVSSATSSLVTASTVAFLVGPAVGGVLITTVSPALVLGVDGLAYLVSALVTARLRWPGSEQRRTPDQVSTLRQDMREGLAFIWGQPVIRSLTVLGAGASLAGGATTGLLVVIGVEQLGLADDDPGLGWLFTAAAVGSLVASLVLPRLQRGFGIGRITMCCFAAGLVLLVVLSFTSGLVLALTLVCLFQAAMTTLIVNGIVTRQVITPERLQSRVNTTARLIAWGGSPVGAALGGVVAETLGTPWAIRTAAAALLASLAGGLVAGLLRYPLLERLEVVED